MKNRKPSQFTDTILMVEPISFGFNHQTAVNNFFQREGVEAQEAVREKALAEFRNMVAQLRDYGIRVVVLKDTADPPKPDSVFPNNWISFHEDGTAVIYPMYAENRRWERRGDEVLKTLAAQGFSYRNVADYGMEEANHAYLEGTGSMVLDRVNRVAFAALSPRTNSELFVRFCREFGYEPVSFTAYQTVNGVRKPIYHTNVMMCIGDAYTIICLDTIDDLAEQKNVTEHLKKLGNEIIEISEEQAAQFAGNMLQVGSTDGRKYLVMSQTARDSLTEDQIHSIEKHNPIIAVHIPTIESEGGSARCMIAEVFLPEAKN